MSPHEKQIRNARERVHIRQPLGNKLSGRTTFPSLDREPLHYRNGQRGTLMPASIVDATQSLEAETKFVIKQVGVVGLGHMGHAFAANLVEDGYQVLGYDRDPSRSVTLTGVSGA